MDLKPQQPLSRTPPPQESAAHSSDRHPSARRKQGMHKLPYEDYYTLSWIIVRLMGVISLLFGASAMANPQGLKIVDGQASMHQEGSSLEIQTTDHAVLHWEDFSISEGETTRFVQPTETSLVLNRVTGLNPSWINGVLESNGKVVLINPQGVIIGKEGIIRTAEFIASTMDILDQAESFAKGGERVPLRWEEQGGSALINHEGMIQATGVERAGGKICLVASEVHINGELIAEQGSVEVWGDQVTLDAHAHLDVSGRVQGGTVLIGGNPGGAHPAVKNTQHVSVSDGALIVANAQEHGDGGKVVVWGDRSNLFQGTILAEGGPSGGDGGWVEVSSLGQFVFKGSVSTLAPFGNIGKLVLDPSDITINAGPTNPAPFTPTYAPTTTAIVFASDIQSALAANNVLISSASGSGFSGQITWNAGFPISWSANTSLTLQATDKLTLESSLTSSGNGAIVLSSADDEIDVLANTNSVTVQTGGPLTLTAKRGIQIHDGVGTSVQLITTGATGEITITSQEAGVSLATVASGNGITLHSLGGANISLNANQDLTVNGDVISSGSGSLHFTSSQSDIDIEAIHHAVSVQSAGPISFQAHDAITLQDSASYAVLVETTGSNGAISFASDTGEISHTCIGSGITVRSVGGGNIAMTAQNKIGLQSVVESGGTLHLTSTQDEIDLSVTMQPLVMQSAGAMTLWAKEDIDLKDALAKTAIMQTTSSLGSISLTSQSGTISFASVGDGITVNALHGLSVQAGESFNLDANGSAGAILMNVSSSSPSTISVGRDMVVWARDSGHFRLNFTSSPLTVTAQRELLLHNYSTTGCEIKLMGVGGSFSSGMTALMEAKSTQGHISITTDPGYDFSWSAGGDLFISNLATSPAYIESGRNLSLSAQGTLYLTGQDNASSAYRAYVKNGTGGTLTLHAGKDVEMRNLSEVLQAYDSKVLLSANGSLYMRPRSFVDLVTPGLSGPNASLTLIVDNANPAYPAIGTGAIHSFGNSFLYSTSEAPPVRLFTARQALNSIGGSIRTETFSAGSFDVDTPTEHWSTYYPNSFVGPVYTVFYKEPLKTPPQPPTPTPTPPHVVVKAQGVPGNVFNTINVFMYPMPAGDLSFCIGPSEKTKWRSYTRRPLRVTHTFDNTTCLWVERNNYRKFDPERKTRF